MGSSPACARTHASVTLLPPVARRLGRRTERLYPVLSRIGALHTHNVTVLSDPR